MNIDRCKGCGYWNKTRRECWGVGRCPYKDDIADKSSVEKKKEVVSPLKTFSDSDGMAFLHIGKDIIPIKMFSVHVNHSADIYPEFTLEGRWMAGSSAKDPSITISKVIFNPPATIVFWKDGSKTVVKCQDGDVFDPEKGLAMAFMKKAYGNTGKYCDEVKKWVEPYDEECVKKQWTKFTEGITDALKKMGEEAIIAGDGVCEYTEATKANLDARKTIEDLFPGVLSKAESLAKHTIMSTEDAIRRLVNERLKDVEPSLHEYYLGQLEPALAKLKESEEKEKKNE